MRSSSTTTAAASKRPKSYMAWSLVNNLLCFCSIYSMFFSVKALNYSFKVEHDIETANLPDARKHSKLAFKFNLISNVIFLLTLILFILVFVFSEIAFNYFLNKALKKH